MSDADGGDHGLPGGRCLLAGVPWRCGRFGACAVLLAAALAASPDVAALLAASLLAAALPTVSLLLACPRCMDIYFIRECARAAITSRIMRMQRSRVVGRDQRAWSLLTSC